MSVIDIGGLQEWVGKTETRTDEVRETALVQFRGTLERGLVDDAVEQVPPGFHWTLFPPVTRLGELGEDGHPRSQGLLPAMPLSARMWAGGTVVFRAPLSVGDVVTRQTKVTSIEEKSGSAGPLLFVALAHEYCVGQQTVVSEIQNLVYRNPAAPKPPPPADPARSETTFETDPRQLFRYSALTFNTHRIHYDQAYARNVEGYQDLVVHGPLQATLMVNFLAGALGHARIGLRYRGLAPLYVGERGSLCRNGETSGDVWIERSAGQATMKGQYGHADDF
ncbi:FAS1-like dehydratase domain-containing protein [Henriciella litoralis]|uniref:FAS1-like dehydratase domain-containing protein n=1 Tax=Henriciella litoralis TaxID=568102 RepID=UPI0009FC18FA|nr:MaoC family dehydratase N-terminal domain-containing protein [Henriciella litoralis]